MLTQLRVFRSLPKHRDSRTFRYKYLKSYTNIVIDTWENENNKKKGLARLKLDKNKYHKIFSYPLYLLYLFLFSLLHTKNNEIIICMELDTFIPVLLGSLFKGNKIYFDIVDPISQTKFKNLCCNSFFDYIEIFFLKIRKNNIIPNVNRIKYYEDIYKIKINKNNYKVVENVPIFYSNYKNKHPLDTNNYTIGYFGTLERDRGIIELIMFVSNFPSLRLVIAGDGKLSEKIKSISKHNPNIKFIGKYRYKEITVLYKQIDFIWAYYSHKNILHKYASPNKFYEHLAMKTPIIINKYIPQSKIILKYNTGILIENELNVATFKDLYDKIHEYNYKRADFSLWENFYKNYYDNITL